MSGFTRTFGRLVIGYYVVMTVWWIRQEGLAQRKNVRQPGDKESESGATDAAATAAP